MSFIKRSIFRRCHREFAIQIKNHGLNFIFDSKSSKSNWIKWIIVKFDWWFTRFVYCNGVVYYMWVSSEFGRATWIMQLLWVGHCWKKNNLTIQFWNSMNQFLLEFYGYLRPPLFPYIKGSIRFFFFLIFLLLWMKYTIFYSINCLLCNQPLFYDSCHFEVYHAPGLYTYIWLLYVLQNLTTYLNWFWFWFWFQRQRLSFISISGVQVILLTAA